VAHNNERTLKVGSSICMYSGLFALPIGSPAAAAAANGMEEPAPATAGVKALLLAAKLPPPRMASAPRRSVRISAFSSNRLVYTSAWCGSGCRVSGAVWS
jgi:hypothetical protein